MIASVDYIKENGKQIDILKFVLAILVVGIHTMPQGFVCRPLLRLAVPMFFIITSFLFFHKQNELTTVQERKQALKKYVKRVMKLYLFWFVLLLPLTVFFRHWYQEPGFMTLVDVVRNFFFGSTFIASWFLMASVINIVFVWFLAHRNVADVWMMVLGVMFYVVCCLVSNYSFWIEDSVTFQRYYAIYTGIFNVPYNSFPCGLLFVVFGKILVTRRLPPHRLQKIVVLLLGLLMMVLLYGEYIYVNNHGGAAFDDCYFSLMLLCPCLLMLVASTHWGKIDFDTRKLRYYSTIIYCSHASIAAALRALRDHYGFTMGSGFLLMATLLLSMLLGIALVCLEKRKKLRFLKYAH